MTQMLDKVKKLGKWAGVAMAAVGGVLATASAHAATLFTLPDASTTLNGVGAYSTESFTSFLPIAYIVAGLLIGALVVSVVIGSVIRAAMKVTGKGRSGGRRRRR